MNKNTDLLKAQIRTHAKHPPKYFLWQTTFSFCIASKGFREIKSEITERGNFV
jgi:hypothetical protein